MNSHGLRWLMLVVGLGAGALSFAAGRSDAQCNKYCANTWGECLYTGSGQIVEPKGNCHLMRWYDESSSGKCSGSATQYANLCVGANGYCQAPASGEYSRLGDFHFDCGSCSGTTTLTCCASCN
jgi:hypothetical protein